MRVFLTGSYEMAWRDDLADFLMAQQIDVFDSMSYPVEMSSTFKYLKILEECDMLIANLSGVPRRRLISMLEMTYASALAKDIMVVDDICQAAQWTFALPYSMSFPTLDRLKGHLISTISSPRTQSRLLG